MNKNRISIFITMIILVPAGVFVFAQKDKVTDERFVCYTVDTKKQDIKLYWKDDKGENFRSIQNLKPGLTKSIRR
jgi:uncharacterized protein YigE (DUF2233 family)